jgi:antitoxin VapB
MPINVNNPEADALTRKFASLAGVGITEAVLIAMKEAIASRRSGESSRETAARLRQKHGLRTGKVVSKPLAGAVYDEMWEDVTRKARR